MERENTLKVHGYERSRDKGVSPQLKEAQFIPGRDKTYVIEVGKYQREKP